MSKKIQCRSCGSEMPLEYRFCPYCGAKNLAAEQHYDTVAESLCKSLEAGNYAEFSAFMDHYGLKQRDQ